MLIHVQCLTSWVFKFVKSTSVKFPMLRWNMKKRLLMLICLVGWAEIEAERFLWDSFEKKEPRRLLMFLRRSEFPRVFAWWCFFQDLNLANFFVVSSGEKHGSKCRVKNYFSGKFVKRCSFFREARKWPPFSMVRHFRWRVVGLSWDRGKTSSNFLFNCFSG